MINLNRNLGKIAGMIFFAILFVIWIYRVFVAPAYGITMQTITILDMELIVAVTIYIVIEEITVYREIYETDSFNTPGLPTKIPETEIKFNLFLAIICLGIPVAVRTFMRWGKAVIFLLQQYSEPKSGKYH